MKIINNPRKSNPEPSVIRQRIYLGAVLIAVGVVWILYNFDVIGHRFFDLFFSWQMLLAAVGGYFLALRKWAAGGILMFIGAFFVIASLLDICIPFEKIALLVIFIAAGLVLLLSWKK